MSIGRSWRGSRCQAVCMHPDQTQAPTVRGADTAVRHKANQSSGLWLMVPCTLQCLALAALLRFRPEGPALSAWHEMRGQASPERRRPARAALSRTLPRDAWSAWGGAWWGDGGFVGDGGRAGCRAPGSGIDTNTNPDASITRNRTPRCRGEAKSWPYRPQGRRGLGSRDFIPGWWSWPDRPESQGGPARRVTVGRVQCQKSVALTPVRQPGLRCAFRRSETRRSAGADIAGDR